MLDLVSEARALEEVEVTRRKALKSQFWTWLQCKEQYWLQMARTKAIKGKDRNTKYFHTIASFKKSRKFTKSLNGEKGVVTNPRGIKKEITKFFKKLYSMDNAVCLDLESLESHRHSVDQVKGLEALPSVEEIKSAVWVCESSKAPGYDGFNFGFLKKMWVTVAEDLTKAVLTFFESGKMPKSINTHLGGSNTQD